MAVRLRFWIEIEGGLRGEVLERRRVGLGVGANGKRALEIESTGKASMAVLEKGESRREIAEEVVQVDRFRPVYVWTRHVYGSVRVNHQLHLWLPMPWG